MVIQPARKMQSTPFECNDSKFGDVITKIKKVHGLLDSVGSNIANIKCKVGQHHRSASAPPVDTMSEGDGKDVRLHANGSNDLTQTRRARDQNAPTSERLRGRHLSHLRMQNNGNRQLIAASGEGNSTCMERYLERRPVIRSKKTDQRRLSEPFRYRCNSLSPVGNSQSEYKPSMIPRPFTPNAADSRIKKRCYRSPRRTATTFYESVGESYTGGVTAHKKTKEFPIEDEYTPTNSPLVSPRSNCSGSNSKKSEENSSVYDLGANNRPADIIGPANRQILVAKRSNSGSRVIESRREKAPPNSPVAAASSLPTQPRAKRTGLNKTIERRKFTTEQHSPKIYAQNVVPMRFSSSHFREVVSPASGNFGKINTSCSGETDDRLSSNTLGEASNNAFIAAQCYSSRTDPRTEMVHTESVRLNQQDIPVESVTEPNSSIEHISRFSTAAMDDDTNRFVIHETDFVNDPSESSESSTVNAEHLQIRSDVAELTDASSRSIVGDDVSDTKSRDDDTSLASSSDRETPWLPTNLQPVIRERVKRFSERSEPDDVLLLPDKVKSSPISDKIQIKVDMYEKLITKEPTSHRELLEEQTEGIVAKCFEDAFAELETEMDALEETAEMLGSEEIEVPRLDLSHINSDDEVSDSSSPPTQVRRTIPSESPHQTDTALRITIQRWNSKAYQYTHSYFKQMVLKTLPKLSESLQPVTKLPARRICLRMGKVFAVWFFQCCSSLCVLFLLVYATSSESTRDNTFQLLEVHLNKVVSFKRVGPSDCII